MSKPYSSYASLRLRSRRESSPAVTKPTNKKSLNSSPQTTVSLSPKAIGKLKTVIVAMKALGVTPELSTLVDAVLHVVDSAPNSHKLSLLSMVVKRIFQDPNHPLTKLLGNQGQSPEKPWQEEG